MTQRKEKIGGDELRQKIHRLKHKRRVNKTIVTSFHIAFVGAAVTCLAFGNWIGGAAIALMWIAILLSF